MPSGFLWKGATLIYGMVSLGLFVAIATLDGSLFVRQTQKDKEQLAAAQDKYWNLSRPPLGLQHRFFTLRDGHRLHFVERLGSSSKNNLVIFIHGFPDSWILWQKFLLNTRLFSNSTLLAVDLPGYGGSDDLPNAGADTVLEALTDFVVSMRRQYLPVESTEFSKVLVVGHDWGAIVAIRLAAEAAALADRFIIVSAVIPSLAVANAHARFASAKQMFRTYVKHPLSVGLLRKALTTVSPVFSQFSKSGYVFVFNLPLLFSNFFGRLGNAWFLRTLHRVARRSRKFLSDTPAAEAMAASIGPSASECHPAGVSKATDLEPNFSYPKTVAQRTSTSGWPSKLRIYRDGLFLSPWSKSLETLFALSDLEQREQMQNSPHSPHRPSTAGLFESGPPGALLSPATIVYGMKDPAFEPKLGLEGMGDYVVKGSQVVVLDKGGHWLPVEKEGIEIIEEVLVWSLEGEKEPLKVKLADSCEQFGKGVRLVVDN